MSDLDFSKLNPEQEHALRDAYRYIRQRAAWLRAQKKTTIGGSDSNGNALTNSEIQDRTQSQSLIG